jgi:hypothetical protein
MQEEAALHRKRGTMRKKLTGRFLGMHYDWRLPTWERLKRGIWNPPDQRLYTPKSFGWGYSINLAEAARRLRLRR